MSVIPRDVQEVFDETDIELTWDYLEKTFRLNKKAWKAEFEREFEVSSRQITKMEVFVRFGKKYFESPICTLLHRNIDISGTWINLIRFIVKDKLKEKSRERYNR